MPDQAVSFTPTILEIAFLLYPLALHEEPFGWAF
jgi:hypothetical protein